MKTYIQKKSSIFESGSNVLRLCNLYVLMLIQPDNNQNTHGYIENLIIQVSYPRTILLPNTKENKMK